MEAPSSTSTPGTPGTPPPPPFGSPAPRQLRRRPDQGPIAGVCAGLAEYFGVDPVIVRIAAVVLLVTGPGLIAYVLAWIFVPAAEEGPFTTASPAGGKDRGMEVFGIVLLVVAVSVLWGDWWSPGRRFLLPSALIALGAWLLLRRRDEDAGAAALVGPPAPPSPAAGGPQAAEAEDRTATPYARTDATSGPDTTITEDTVTEGTVTDDTVVDDAVTDATAPWAVTDTTAGGGADGGDGPPPVTQSPWGGPPPSTPESATVRRRRSMLGPMVMGALLVWAGAAVILGVSVATGLAVGLCIVGLGFVLGAFVGGSWALIVPAIVIGAALIPTALLDLPLTGPIGERTWAPRTLDEVEDRYEMSIGEGTLDLRGLEMEADERIFINGSVGIGHLIVEVPDGMTVDVEGDVSMGELVILGMRSSGVGVGDERLLEGDGSGGTVELRLRVGIGQVEVRRVPPGVVAGDGSGGATTSTSELR